MDNIESGIQTFYFEHNRIQMMAIGSDPYFNLEDVCEILKIKDTKRAKARLDEQGVCDAMTLTSSGFQKKDFISETNLYRLIFKSRRLENIKFAVWVMSEVLPVFIRNKVAKKLIKDLEKLRDEDLEELRERNSLK
ncbi:BRO-N domain-containing protein [Lactobacillus iners]|uniref:BRO-N domain-containing protein n=1 Tax=Lactobacillus iners TaxID=147802 RepID=UPI0001FD79BB|nr:BRO family protein [Lactobacillus iners]EGC81068.1 BRO family, N-terminal domain protein [Lactobacillus iners UPII 60-B]